MNEQQTSQVGTSDENMVTKPTKNDKFVIRLAEYFLVEVFMFIDFRSFLSSFDFSPMTSLENNKNAIQHRVYIIVRRFP